MFIKGRMIVADFKDYIKSFGASAQAGVGASEAAQKTPEEKAKEVIDKYSNFSEEQLLMELSKQIKLQKQNNQYNKNRVLNEIDALSAFLTPEQQARIKEILNNAEK